MRASVSSDLPLIGSYKVQPTLSNVGREGRVGELQAQQAGSGCKSSRFQIGVKTRILNNLEDINKFRNYTYVRIYRMPIIHRLTLPSIGSRRTPGPLPSPRLAGRCSGLRAWCSAWPSRRGCESWASARRWPTPPRCRHVGVNSPSTFC